MRRDTGLDEFRFSSSQCVQVGTCGPSTVTVAPTSALLSPVHDSWSLKGLPGLGVSSGPRLGDRMVPSVCKRTGPSGPEGPGASAPSPSLAGGGLPALGPRTRASRPPPAVQGRDPAPPRVASHWPARTPVRERGFESFIEGGEVRARPEPGLRRQGEAAPRGAGARWPPGGVRFSFYSFKSRPRRSEWRLPPRAPLCRPVREPRAVGNGYASPGARAPLSPARSPGAQRLNRRPLREPPRGRSGPGPLRELRSNEGHAVTSILRRLHGEGSPLTASDIPGAAERTAHPPLPFSRRAASRDPLEVPGPQLRPPAPAAETSGTFGESALNGPAVRGRAPDEGAS
ncbi:unnamed protein product [Rangifer tarandus platyrhynchus]|uniref:Uncharacterized protein n=2 Tax=Rangifer tarandus platyrhynchus TaxID=3082113 RepID=A0ABN8YTG6_RANTA|nr:unnamed protein product [Rangifer tarandus platyrhynchus]CAI9702279.1 unnamed protein product [Rangifer tarandus platyrhynchus]